MHLTPMASTLSRDGVARAMIGSHATDPVLPDTELLVMAPRAPRTRNLLAAALRRVAQAVAVPEQRPAC